MNHFEELRRMAFQRGMSDYDRAKQMADADGSPIFKNNPHQNNHATDEKESWEEGWESAESDDPNPGHPVSTAPRTAWPFPVVYGEIPNGKV